MIRTTRRRKILRPLPLKLKSSTRKTMMMRMMRTTRRRKTLRLLPLKLKNLMMTKMKMMMNTKRRTEKTLFDFKYLGLKLCSTKWQPSAFKEVAGSFLPLGGSRPLGLGGGPANAWKGQDQLLHKYMILHVTWLHNFFPKYC